MPTERPSERTHVLVTRLAGARVAFAAASVEAIVRAVSIEPLAGAPPIIEGTINLRGTPVPVVDIRRRLGLQHEPLLSTQFFVILTPAARRIAVRVDDVHDMIEIDVGSLGTAAALSPTLRHVAGVAPVADGTVVIYDVAGFLDAAEQAVVDALLASAGTAT